jgi:phospholipase/carboxylesterase
MSSVRNLEGPIIKSEETTKAIVIFLHGWGSDGNDLIQIAHNWKNELQQTSFIAPNGPEVCTENPLGRQWFNIMTEEDVMLRELDRAYLDLKEFINIKVKECNIESNNYFLVGFSQGTMLALYTAIREKMSGVVGYSGAFIEKTLNISESRNDFLLIHGNEDKVVPVNRMYNAHEILKDKVNYIDTKVYDGLEHSINDQGLKAGCAFIRKRLDYLLKH